MAANSFKTISQNIASSKKVERITEILKRQKPDIMLLQEVTLTTAQLQAAVLPFQYKCESNIDTDNPNSPGTAAIWKMNLPVSQVTSLVTCNLQTVRIGAQAFFNIYAPSGSENRRQRVLLFSRDMFPHILQHQSGLLPVLAGDWNCLVAAADTTNNFRGKYCKDLENLLKAFKYQDAFRILHPLTIEFTFHRASCAPSRLDRLYVPPHLQTSLLSATHLPGLADHWGVEVLMNLEVTRLQLPPRPPRTHWKLNSSILKHESFLPQFSQLFQQLLEDIDEFEDAADWWDLLAKPTVSSFCKLFSISLAKQRKTFKNFLFALLTKATNQGDWCLVIQTREKLKAIIAYEANGLIVRSRNKQNSEEEAASLFHMAKTRKANLTKLRVSEDGKVGYRRNVKMVVTEDPARIEQETVSFVDSLLNGRQDRYLQDTGETFQPDDTHLEEFLANLSQLTQASQDGLVVPLSVEEVGDAIKASENGKSPGLDGLTYEFYKATWSVISGTFTKVLQAQLDREKLMESGQHGATRLLPKVEAVPDVTELRPITLLQVDYRLLSRCLAARLHTVMHEVVDARQLGVAAPGMGGGILTGLYNILSSIDYVNLKKLKAFLASFDNMKAYDRANTVYLEKVTARMAFPPVFRSWLKMLHLGATTKIILPGGLSREIKVVFSFRQGDCIAGDLYCLTLEPLLRMLRRKLVGLCIFNFFEKDTSYLDDIELISGEVQDLVMFNKVMVKYEKQSGAMLSRDRKSKVMGLGLWRGKEDWPREVSWLQTVPQMKVLGLVVSPLYSETLRHTWDNAFRGLQKTLFSWESRALSTLQQRVTVLQTFAMSKLWYTAQVLPLPVAMVKKIESASSAFIFRGRPERLKLADLQNPVEKGGLGLTCVATKAECLLLRQSLRILHHQESNCSRHLGFWLGSSLEEAFPHLSTPLPALPPNLPLHRAMLEALEEGLLRNEFDPKKLESTSSRTLYKSRAADVIPIPKVETKYPGVDFHDLVYPRLRHSILESEPRDILFCLVNNIVPNRERLFTQQRAQDPFCPLLECQGKVQDTEHLFCSCYQVNQAWLWLRTKLLNLLPNTVGAVGTSSEDFILLRFPKDTMDKEVVWLLGNYCDIVMQVAVGKKRRLMANQMAALLRSRLLILQARAVVMPQIYNI